MSNKQFNDKNAAKLTTQQRWK